MSSQWWKARDPNRHDPREGPAPAPSELEVRAGPPRVRLCGIHVSMADPFSCHVCMGWLRRVSSTKPGDRITGVHYGIGPRSVRRVSVLRTTTGVEHV